MKYEVRDKSRFAGDGHEYHCIDYSELLPERLLMRQLTFGQLDKLSSVLVIPHLIMLRLSQVLMV